MRALLLLASLTGCAQLFGLEATSFDQQDGAVDAPSVCDGAPACTNSTGRSVCGQVFDTGAQAGTKLRVAEPTGERCVAGNTEGPCALTVTGSPMQLFFDNMMMGQVAGLIDDCGRYVVGDLDPNAADVAIVLADLSTAPVFTSTARLLLDRPTISGIDQDIDALAVTLATTTEWAMQADPVAPPETTTGYLVTYQLAGTPVPEMSVALDGGSALASEPGTIPWAGYFGAGVGFGTIEATTTQTSDNGTALTVLPAGPFSLEGVRTGKRCVITDLRSVANTLIHLVEEGC